jgi:hypothetical protein
MTDLVVLTEGAQEIAGTEKNRPGASRPDQGGFLAEMALETCDHRIPPGPADADLSFQAVGPASAGTKTAVTQALDGTPDLIL